MDVVGSILGLILFYGIVGWLLIKLPGWIVFVVKSLFGFGKFPPFQIKLEKQFPEESGVTICPIEVMGKDTIPSFPPFLPSGDSHIANPNPDAKTRNIRFVTSVIDVTNHRDQPVYSTVDSFREPSSLAFQYVTPGGEVPANSGFQEWVKLALIVPDTLVPPYGGKRNLRVITRIIDNELDPNIHLGACEKGNHAVLGTYTAEFIHDFQQKGHEEIMDSLCEGAALIVRLGVMVASVHNQLAQTEAGISAVSFWIRKQLFSLTDSAYLNQSMRERTKEACNEALRTTYAKLKSNPIITSALDKIPDLTDTLRQLNDLNDNALKLEAMELCMLVMASDGVASEKELKLIHYMARELKIAPDAMQQLKDRHLISLNTLPDQNSLEEVLGIVPDWDQGQIRSHLQREFAKWNGRLNNIRSPEERGNVQKMLDLIAEARKKYV